MPHVDTVPIVVVGADDACAFCLSELVAAQRSLGYWLIRPVLLRRIVPAGWGENDVVRFGLPQPVGDLYGIDPSPERNLGFWTRLLLALTVVWEAGAVPQLAEELWEQLCLGRTMSLRDAGFDAWLERHLNEFAVRNIAKDGATLPTPLAFGPSDTIEDGLWQQGVVAWQEGFFDVTPLRARLWIDLLPDDAREALRRRRLTNVPLARWLSAWASSIEESLRVAALQAGGTKFRQYLLTQPPRNRRDLQIRSRWHELSAPDDIGAVDSADFGDLAGFVAQAWSTTKRPFSLAHLLEQCRVARNRVVHERRLSGHDLLLITRLVDWLSQQGLI